MSRSLEVVLAWHRGHVLCCRRENHFASQRSQTKYHSAIGLFQTAGGRVSAGFAGERSGGGIENGCGERSPLEPQGEVAAG